MRGVSLIVAVAFLGGVLAYAQQGKKAKEAKAPPRAHFKAVQLHVDNNEGCDVGDIDKDGLPDVIAGEFWYRGPEFTEKRRVRKLMPFGDDYLTNNGEHLFDVNGDGWLDVVSGSFQETKLMWFENPGEAAVIEAKELWVARELAEIGHQQNEITMAQDLDGDGRIEMVVNSWNDNNPLVAFRIAGDGSGVAQRIPIGEAGTQTNGHGMGFGDINGDGREDIIFKNGWYERPAGDAMAGGWALHRDWDYPHASCPMLVLDLDGDGRNDVVWADGHNYGLYWMRQKEPAADGTTNWRMHTIDKRFAQPHALAWADIDGDGAEELITGKRVRAHSGRDPGEQEEPVIIYYDWVAETLTFTKHEVHRGQAGIGLQIRVADMNGDGKPDIVCAGKSGTHVLFNEGVK